MKDLEQMSAEDAEGIIDSIEELMLEASRSSGGAGGLAHPVLSKSNRSSMQGELDADHQFCHLPAGQLILCLARQPLFDSN